MILDEKNYVDKAERVMGELAQKKGGDGKPDMVTTSQIRNLLSMAADIYNEVMICAEERLGEDICGRIDYLKIRFLYAAGREPKVKDFVEKAQVIECIGEIKGEKKNYLLFYRYMESLIAYHRFLGGRDS